MTTNEDLKALYDRTYADGTAYAGWHTDVDTFEESMLIYEMGRPWRGKRVLEIGCGEGRLAALLAMAGANAFGVDYSSDAILAAQMRYDGPNIHFEVGEAESYLVRDRWDAIVMQGVLEHMDKPWKVLKSCCDVAPIVITSSPNFLNPRGYILETLRILLEVPTSLTDLYYFLPGEFSAFAQYHHLNFEYRSCHYGWAAGDEMRSDLSKRLPKCLKDAGLPVKNCHAFMRRLLCMSDYMPSDKWAGATIVYRLERPT